jgi:hypothetical protein
MREEAAARSLAAFARIIKPIRGSNVVDGTDPSSENSCVAKKVVEDKSDGCFGLTRR